MVAELQVIRSGKYCRIQIKSTPLCDCDTPDEILFLSPRFGSCDMVKISSVVPAEQYILVVIGLKFIGAYRRWSENLLFTSRKPNFGPELPYLFIVMVQTFCQYPFVMHDSDHISAHQVPSVTCD